MGRLLRRVLSFFRSDGHLSRTLVAQCLERPTRELERAALKRSLFGLAPNEVYIADLITQFAGGLLHHRFTLTDCSAVYFLLHYLSGYPGWVLPTILLFGARTFLVSKLPRPPCRPIQAQV